MTEGKIVDWVKAPGDKVEKGETVVIVESDKADMDVETFNEGYLAVIVAEAGETAPVGEAIALIAETEAEIETAKQQAANLGKPAGASTAGAAPASAAPATTAPTESAPAAPAAVAETNGAAATKPSGRIVASPRARKLAKKAGVDLATIQGSGPHGRIVAADVEAASGQSLPSKAAYKFFGYETGVMTDKVAGYLDGVAREEFLKGEFVDL